VPWTFHQAVAAVLQQWGPGLDNLGGMGDIWCFSRTSFRPVWESREKTAVLGRFQSALADFRRFWRGFAAGFRRGRGISAHIWRRLLTPDGGQRPALHLLPLCWGHSFSCGAIFTSGLQMPAPHCIAHRTFTIPYLTCTMSPVVGAGR
jgi:hypothetical protein